MAATRRIGKELADFQSNPISGVTVQLVDNNLFKWDVTVKGPAGSPYAGGTFKLKLNLPAEYPFKPPVLSFETRIYHPNVSNDEKGSMCLGILRPESWKPSCKLLSVLEMALGLLAEPNIDDAVESSIADQFKNDHDKYVKTAKQFVEQHAKK